MPQIVISDENITIRDQFYTGDLSALMPHEDGRPYHTFRTYSVLVNGNHINFVNCTFENTAGPGEKAGQALALYLDGDEIHLDSCRLLGHQDTLFMAPLPEKEVEKDGFIGPGKDLPRTPRTFYFRNCYIEGGVDFVFGGATAYFDDCEFCSVEPGYVFAPSTPEGTKEGIVCRNCRFTRKEGLADASTYLGRPWREHARVRLENCYMDSHIRPEGWHDWGKPNAHTLTSFVEIGSYGPGADGAARPDWVSFS